MNGTALSILSAGAAESLINRLRDDAADLGIELDASFGAVGAMKERFLAGARCDLFITSGAVMADLRTSRQLDAEVIGDLGWVQTGVAVRAVDPVPDVSTPAAVTEVLRAAREMFVPDPVRSTAGIHFAKVLDQVGLTEGDGVSWNTYPNGASAMRALADSEQTGAVGCTQVTEILQTPGVTLAGPLPRPYDLVTRYQCALIRSAHAREEAVHMYELLTGAQTATLREELGLNRRE